MNICKSAERNAGIVSRHADRRRPAYGGAALTVNVGVSVTENQAPTGIALKSHHVWFVLYWYFLRVFVKVDGTQKFKRGWGESFVPLTPGRHEIFVATVSITGIGWKPGKSTITVDVAPGQVVRLNYRAPTFMFPGLKGKLSVDSQVQAAAA
jgi:hypothetical protein